MNQKRNTSLSNCSLTQLHKLLSAVAEGTSKQKSLPAMAATLTEWRPCLDSLCQAEDQNGDILVEMICEPSTSVDIQKAIKEKAKQFYKKAKNESERTSCMILYHSSIAAAFGYHGKKISSRPMGKLMPIFGDLALALRNDPVVQIFREAIEKHETDSLD